MTKSQMVKEAMEYNRCAVIAKKRFGYGKLPATIEGFKDRRNYLIKLARTI